MKETYSNDPGALKYLQSIFGDIIVSAQTKTPAAKEDGDDEYGSIFFSREAFAKDGSIGACGNIYFTLKDGREIGIVISEFGSIGVA